MTEQRCEPCQDQRTPPEPQAGCPCCGERHYGGHFDADGQAR